MDKEKNDIEEFDLDIFNVSGEHDDIEMVFSENSQDLDFDPGGMGRRC